MREIIEGMKNMNVLEQTISLKSALSDDQRQELETLADAIVSSMGC